MSSSITIDCTNSVLHDIAPASIAVVLGSGLAGVTVALSDCVAMPYEALPQYPAAISIPGHLGQLIVGEMDGVRLALFNGRVHLYQGVNACEAAWPARMAAALGCETLVVTNASGAVSSRMQLGQIALICDHMNLMGANPLTGWAGVSEDGRFVPMHNAYDPGLHSIAKHVAAVEGIGLLGGVYAALSGPSYETLAEVVALRAIGVDMVGMSSEYGVQLPHVHLACAC